MSSIFWQIRAVADNWDKEIFKNLHHKDFLFIRETELLTRDEHVDNIDRLIKEKDFLKTHKPQLIHENEFVSEARWEDNGELVTRVFLMKDGKAWRQIVSRVPIEKAA